VPVPADTPASAAAATGKGPPKPGPAAPVVQAAPAPAPAAAPAAATGSAAAASAARAARYVVQVGAFSEATTAREVRLKVERLGLKTYTQVVETEGGKRTRVRVGPFASREEAMQTLARIQSANLPGVVLAL
jgi:DedD protein